MAPVHDALRDVSMPASLPAMLIPPERCSVGPLGQVVNPARARCQRLKQGVTGAARLLEEQAVWESRGLGRSAYSKKFITLTFRDGDDWQPRCVSDFLHCVRQWLKRRGYAQALKYVHVAELQKRGAIHYHVVLWLPRKLRLPCPDRCGWWPWGMSQVQTARNPVGYLVKYATKTRPETVGGFPKGARIYGRGGLTPPQRVELRETTAPWWVQKLYKQRDQAPGPCMVSQETGERFPLFGAESIRAEVDEHGTVRWVRSLDGVPDDVAAEYFEGTTTLFDVLDAEGYFDHIYAYARQYGHKGCPRFQRVAGGFADLMSGEFIETPYRVDVQNGVVSIHLKNETVQ